MAVAIARFIIRLDLDVADGATTRPLDLALYFTVVQSVAFELFFIMGKTNNAIELGSIIDLLFVMFESLGVANKRFSADLNLRFILLKLMNEINIMSVGYRM